MKLSHEVLLALAYVSQITDPDSVRSRFIESLNALDKSFTFKFVDRLPPGVPEYRVLPIATLRSSFGYAMMADGPETSEADHAVFRTAFQFLAVLLENRMQARALESTNVSLLKKSENKYRLLADHVSDVIFVLDMNLNYTYISPSVKILRGYEPEEALKLPSSETLTPSSWDLARKTLSEVMELEKSEHPNIPISRTLQLEVNRKDGTTVWTEMKFSLIRNEDQQPVGILGVTRDITDRKRVEEELRMLAVRKNTILAAVPDIIMEVDVFKRYMWANLAGLQFFGEDVLGHEASYYFEGEQEVYIKVQPLFTGNEDVIYVESWQRRQDGEKRLLSWWCKVLKDEQGRVIGAISTARDITDQKRMEDDLRESEEKYRILFENAGEAVFVAQGGKLVFLNPKTTMVTGYSREEIASMPFVEFIYADDRDMVMDRYVRRLNGENIPRQYSFRVIHKNGDVRWVELDTVRINWKGEPATLNFMGDITNRKQTEEQLLVSLEQLRRAVKTTIQVMGSAVESRDPYTAGHQIRSADLALAIATEMGLPQEKIDGIRMAGSIHDIGKLSIPAEILAKPTKLHEIEFSLIKEHARTGCEMLKDVESPWPLAEIVYQHHERMDGSGYPRHLKGEEILMEARILAVTDVVEAMASHRPYRPSLGIEAALKEIEKNRGALYDPEVVDTCLRLFNEKGYKFD